MKPTAGLSYQKVCLALACTLACSWQSFARAEVAPNWPYNASTVAPYRVRIVDDGTVAVEQRLRMIDRAQTKIDLMPYTLENNDTGSLILHKLMEKALQGVHVRVFIDFWNETGRPDMSDEVFAAIQKNLAARAGPGGLKGSFEIRYYNRGMMKLHPLAMNHRLHAKIMNVDDREIAIGGRNYGDDYFNYDDGINFLDRDAWVLVPKSAPAANLGAQVAAAFDLYWNSDFSSEPKPWDSSREFSDLTNSVVTPDADSLAKENGVRAKIAQAALPVIGTVREEFNGTAQMPTFVTKHIGFVMDKPGSTKESRIVTEALDAEISKARRYLLMENYTIASTDRHHNMILNIANKLNVPVILLTNSYAANKATILSHFNRDAEKSFLKKSANIWEVEMTGAAEAGNIEVKALEHRLGKYEIHSKSVVIYDDVSATSIVGSYNFDGRSDIYNNEVSLIFYDDPYVANQIARNTFNRIAAGHQLMLGEKSKLQYVDGTAVPDSKKQIVERFFQFIGLSKVFRNFF